MTLRTHQTFGGKPKEEEKEKEKEEERGKMRRNQKKLEQAEREKERGWRNENKKEDILIGRYKRQDKITKLSFNLSIPVSIRPRPSSSVCHAIYESN